MPVGKNSIKRAVNNGYSKVKTSAPDMENSEVVEVKEEKKVKAAEKKAPAKCAAKTQTKEVKPKTPAKKAVKAQKDGFIRVEVGESMPYYLL